MPVMQPGTWPPCYLAGRAVLMSWDEEEQELCVFRPRAGGPREWVGMWQKGGNHCLQSLAGPPTQIFMSIKWAFSSGQGPPGATSSSQSLLLGGGGQAQWKTGGGERGLLWRAEVGAGWREVATGRCCHCQPPVYWSEKPNLKLKVKNSSFIWRSTENYKVCTDSPLRWLWGAALRDRGGARRNRNWTSKDYSLITKKLLSPVNYYGRCKNLGSLKILP